MSNYYCDKCGKIEKYDLSPHELKCTLNPHLAIKGEWNDEDWKAPIGFCECGGEIKSGEPKKRVTITFQDSPRYSWAMGVNRQDIPKAMREHPDRTYHPKTGQLLVKNRTEKKKLMSEHGYYD